MMEGDGYIQFWLSGHGRTSGVPLLFVKLLSESTPLFHGIERRYIGAAGADDHLVSLDQANMSCNGRNSQKKAHPKERYSQNEGLFPPIFNADSRLRFEQN
jgi:hypothetical protein